MASSWGDERNSLRFRKNEIWVPVDDLEMMAVETEKLVERLETIRPILTAPELAVPTVPA